MIKSCVEEINKQGKGYKKHSKRADKLRAVAQTQLNSYISGRE